MGPLCGPGSEGSEGSKGSKGKVLKMDGPSAQGFLSLKGPLAPRVVVSPSRAMSMKSALRDCRYGSYSLIHILRIGSLCSPPPIRTAPDFPRKQGQNKTPRNTLFINGSTVSTGYSATVHILHRMCKLVKVSPKPAHKRAFLLIDQPNCGGGKGTGFIGEL